MVLEGGGSRTRVMPRGQRLENLSTVPELHAFHGWMKCQMRTLWIAVVSWIPLACLAGCAFPGSAVGRVSIRGSLTSDTGQPLRDREVQFILPAEYGMGGLDLVFSEPEEMGHEDHHFSVTTDARGEFSYDLGYHVYHIVIWILPPLGLFSSHPPPPPSPFVVVRAPGLSGEYYTVDTNNGEYRVFSAEGSELSLEQARLSGLSTSSESGVDDDGVWTVGIIDLQVADR